VAIAPEKGQGRDAHRRGGKEECHVPPAGRAEDPPDVLADQARPPRPIPQACFLQEPSRERQRQGEGGHEQEQEEAEIDTDQQLDAKPEDAEEKVPRRAAA
jgi:hypothetical protein